VKSVRLTEAGQVLKPLARELLPPARRLDETMSCLNGEVVGEMTVGVQRRANICSSDRPFQRKFTVRINVW
jgi:DNA-binding transcriptional LysR family regulator